MRSLGLFSGATLLVTVSLIAGCGNDDEPSQADLATTPKVAGELGLPRPSSRSLRTLIEHLPQGPVLAPSVTLLEPGRNRFGFGLFDRGNRQIGDLTVGVYVARGLDDTARGPFPARWEPITVRDRYRSKQTVEDPEAATAVYVARLPFAAAGSYAVTAIAKLGGTLVATAPIQVMVSQNSPVPNVGDRAISVHTPTVASVDGDIKQIETRDPPDTMHRVDLADALRERRPTVLLFSTPALCESRLCGPVTDVAEQVKAAYRGRAEFIHMEIYNDNDMAKGVRPQVKAWRLPKEPFAFAINSRGRVAARLEGGFSARELQLAVRRSLR